jgi:hypothetical protein
MSTTPDVLIHEQDESTLQAVVEYWTEERMANAVPFPLPSISQEEFEKLTEDGEGLAPESSQSIDSSDDAEASFGANPVDGTPTRANVNERPFWNGGKLFFSDDKGNNYWGSAQFCAHNQMVLTAAHCVMNATTGQWYTKFHFVRAYSIGFGQRVGVRAVGVWTWWSKPPVGVNRYAYDYAWAITKEKSGAGWMGLHTHMPYPAFLAIGYPNNYGAGQSMYRVDGTEGTISENIVQMVGNPMRKGCSGGAWVKIIGDKNWVVGINSFSKSLQPDNEYGPYLERVFFDLYTYMKNKYLPSLIVQQAEPALSS